MVNQCKIPIGIIAELYGYEFGEIKLSQNPGARILVATDQKQYLDFFKRRYGERVIYQDCLRSGNSTNPVEIPGRDRVAQGEEVLRDALLLARCDLLVRGTSAVCEYAHYFNPSLVSLWPKTPLRLRFLGRLRAFVKARASWRV